MEAITELFKQDIPSLCIGLFILLSAFIATYEIIGKISVIVGKPVRWVKKEK